MCKSVLLCVYRPSEPQFFAFILSDPQRTLPAYSFCLVEWTYLLFGVSFCDLNDKCFHEEFSLSLFHKNPVHTLFYTFHIRWVSHNKNVFIGLQTRSRKRVNSDWATAPQTDLKETTVIEKRQNFYCLMDEGPERVLISNCFGCSGKKISREQCVVKERK